MRKQGLKNLILTGHIQCKRDRETISIYNKLVETDGRIWIGRVCKQQTLVRAMTGTYGNPWLSMSWRDKIHRRNSSCNKFQYNESPVQTSINPWSHMCFFFVQNFCKFCLDYRFLKRPPELLHILVIHRHYFGMRWTFLCL